ncbi:flagellar biosynthesis protein FlhF [Marinimicrobium sp. C2-29]|uniref:flagellar biosynthesis protein FlhF n=1 Tax=Marinimicrobium sp. C2-29 TaxID=3139825 RepID=UPI0031397B66
MQVKRFLAADMRRALEMVRQELGPDAVILSSNRTKEGVELLTTKATPAMPEMPPEPEPSMSAPEPDQAIPQAGRALPQTGKERAAAIEQARQRQQLQRDVEASAEEFLKPNQTVNAGIPAGHGRVAAAMGADRAPGSGSVQHHSEPRREDRRSDDRVSDVRRFQSAAERYPLHDETVSDRAQRPAAQQPTRNPYAASASGEAPSSGPQLRELQEELAEMRLLLEEQLSQVVGERRDAPKPPALASISRRLARMGLPASAVEAVMEGATSQGPLARSWSDALARLSRQLPVDNADRVDKGGVFALVGPTGAGKTTSIGKLAARYVMAHGASEVALVTLDTHRIGGHDQLRSLARILGITVKVVDDRQSLDSVLYNLRRCSLVLIDTAGFRQGDPRLLAQMALLESQPKVENLLVLPCNSQEAMLKASLHAYSGAGLAGCILTKLDESASLGEAMGVVMQSGVPIVYTTHGQDIPRDLDVARGHQLVARAAALIKQTHSERRSVDPEQPAKKTVRPRSRAV